MPASKAAVQAAPGTRPCRGSQRGGRPSWPNCGPAREAHETIEAIRAGGVDSLVIGPPGQEQVYALTTADRPYRLIVEAMNEGAAIVSPRGVILDANPRLARDDRPAARNSSAPRWLTWPPMLTAPRVPVVLDVSAGRSARGETELSGPGGTTVPVLLSVSSFDLDGMAVRCLIMTDLTAQRAAERQAAEAHEALREQTSFLEQAQASVGLGWWTLRSGPGRRCAPSSPAASPDLRPWPRPGSTGRLRDALGASSTRTTLPRITDAFTAWPCEGRAPLRKPSIGVIQPRRRAAVGPAWQRSCSATTRAGPRADAGDLPGHHRPEADRGRGPRLRPLTTGA